MSFNQRNIFLLDGIGALLSFVFTALILPFLFQWTGLPPWFLYILAVLPLAFSIYSLACYKLAKVIHSWMLKTIVFANLFYCVISVITIFVFPSVTGLGKALLAAEILIILAVICLEIRIYKKAFGHIVHDETD